jgi:hypothetical protein
MRPAAFRRARSVVRDPRGATVVEFAAIAPAMLMLILGLLDLSFNIYTSTLLEGAIQKAGRDASLEGASGRSLAIDNRVRRIVGDLVRNATIEIDRRAYTDFSDVSQPEDFSDLDGNGLCNGGEAFEDANGNGTYDTDRGVEGVGSARDAVLYTVTVNYPRAFPVMSLLGFDSTVTAQARTILRNQPFGTQRGASAVGSCL